MPTRSCDVIVIGAHEHEPAGLVRVLGALRRPRIQNPLIVDDGEAERVAIEGDRPTEIRDPERDHRDVWLHRGPPLAVASARLHPEDPDRALGVPVDNRDLVARFER